MQLTFSPMFYVRFLGCHSGTPTELLKTIEMYFLAVLEAASLKSNVVSAGDSLKPLWELSFSSSNWLQGVLGDTYLQAYHPISASLFTWTSHLCLCLPNSLSLYKHQSLNYSSLNLVGLHFTSAKSLFQKEAIQRGWRGGEAGDEDFNMSVWEDTT